MKIISVTCGIQAHWRSQVWTRHSRRRNASRLLQNLEQFISHWHDEKPFRSPPEKEGHQPNNYRNGR